jgi:hypothetical protein
MLHDAPTVTRARPTQSRADKCPSPQHPPALCVTTHTAGASAACTNNKPHPWQTTPTTNARTQAATPRLAAPWVAWVATQGTTLLAQ